MVFFLLMTIFSTAHIYPQSFEIDFSGTGASIDVDSVKVENLNLGTSIILSGHDILNLRMPTDLPYHSSTNKVLEVYPNPISDHADLNFYMHDRSTVLVCIVDLTGKLIVQLGKVLSQGVHTYHISGLKQGVYFIRISTPNSSFTSKLVCNGGEQGNADINYISSISGIKTTQHNSTQTKSASDIISFYYEEGTRLKFTGISGNYKTVLTDIPSSNKTITFEFIECTDGDENHYPIVQIGSQVWMAENLKTTKYMDGNAVPNVTDGTEWSKQTTPAFCWYNNDSVTNSKIYGALYNWHTVKTGDLCPSGWHVPTDSTWSELEIYLQNNGYNYDGSFDTDDDPSTNNYTAKSLAAFILWNSSNKEGGVGNTDYPSYQNKTGLSILPSGRRSFEGGDFGGIGIMGNWGGCWTSTEDNSTKAWYRSLYYSNKSVHRSTTFKQAGFPVRCVRD
jgi:uncharacterized protein (TIGR02145 family)